MTDEFFTTASELKTRGEPFAAVTVVRNEAPSSGKSGDKAIFGKNGLLAGWIGGGCVYSIAMKEVGEALQDGKPRFVRVSPDPKSEPAAGVREYKMTCHSGGTVDLFIEPVMPRPHLIILGKSVIGRALMRLAKAADYSVTVVNDEATRDAFPDADHWKTQFDLSDIAFDDRTFIVVSTQGDRDERALEAALSVACRYVGFVGSRKKRDGVFDFLKKKGFTDAQLQAVHAPVGLDINGKTPEEVAVSILAEIIQEYRTKDVSGIQFSAPKKRAAAEKPPESPDPKRPQIITNPVCGMPISLGMAKYIVETGGEPIYFCCDGCKIKFDAEPEKYLEAAEKG